MFQFADKPLSVFQIYQQSFTLYKNTFFKVWYVILINLAIVNFIQLFAPAVNISSGVAAPGAATANIVTSAIPANAWQFWMYLIVSSILSMYFSAVVIHRIHHLAGSQAGSVVSSYLIVLRKLIFIVLTLVVCTVLIGLGFVALWVPGIFLMFLLVFSLAAILFEDKKLFGAIKRSCQLVWGNWWHTFSVFAPILIISLLFVVGIALVFGVISAAIFQSSWFVAGAFAGFSIIFGPLFFSIYVVQYNDLLKRQKTEAEKQVVIAG